MKLVRVAGTALAHYRRPRVLGLDLLRIAACATILIFHGNPPRAVGRNWISWVFARDGFLGVDIFFVLSGWLLTRQALRMRDAFRSSARFATTFWVRRWIRTLPPYWVVLAGLFAFGSPALAEPMTPLQLAAHALFLQTLVPPNLFLVSWSLVTEEWFYLLLPLVVLLASRVKDRRLGIGLGIGALLFPAGVRAFALLQGLPVGYVLAEPPARFDGLVVGALLAAASLSAPWWPAVMERRRILFGAGCLGLVGVLAAGVDGSLLFRVAGLLAFNLCIGALLPQLSQLRWPAVTPMAAVMATAFLSELTYPLYLLHRVVPHLHWVEASGPVRLLLAAVSIIALLGVAAALHLGIERPLFALRDRYLASPHPRVASATWKEPAPASARPLAASRSLVA
jgi:peptidoglycan/LPS O-acetylase OafA/YrhL